MTDRVTPSDIAEAKAVDLCNLIGGKWERRSTGYWRLCPFHTEKTPSFKVDKAGFYKCFGCGEKGDAISYVRKMEGLRFGEAVARLKGAPTPTRFGGVRVSERQPRRVDDDGHDKQRRALRMWKEALPISGTHAEKYLRARGIRIPLGDALRFAPSEFHRESGRNLPCLLALLTDDHAPQCVQRTFLDPDAPKKADVEMNKKTLGLMMGATVRLHPARHERLGLAEGVESSLSATQTYATPTWAVCGVHRLTSVDIPKTVRKLSIFADPGAVGEEQAYKAQHHWERLGLDVEVYLPRGDFDCAPDADFNDIVRARG